jgi:hypothetical protein
MQALPALVAAIEQQQLRSLEHACVLLWFCCVVEFVADQRSTAM